MNKKELIYQMAEASGLSQKDCAKALSSFCCATERELAKGGEIRITGFGTFKTRNRAARTGKNPKTGMPVQIPAARVLAFTAGKSLKDKVQ